MHRGEGEAYVSGDCACAQTGVMSETCVTGDWACAQG